MKLTMKEPLTNIVVLLLILLNMISFFNLPLFNLYNEFSFYMNLGILLMLFLFTIKYTKEDQRFILYLLLYLSYGFFNIYINNSGLGSVITPAFSLLVYWIIKKQNFSDNLLKIITLVMFVTFTFWLINSPGYYERFYFNKNIYLNSNTVATIIMYTSIYLSIFIRYFNLKFSHLLVLPIYLLGAWGIANCQSRASLLGLLVFIFFDFCITKKIWSKRYVPALICFTIIITGVLFTYIYVQMYVNNIYYSLPLINKPLYTGREVIWYNFYDQISRDSLTFLFGIGSDAILWDGESLNLHNSYLTIFNNVGFIGFILYFLFWIKEVNLIRRRTKYLTTYQIHLITGFFCVLVQGFLEVTMLWQNMFFLNFMFLGLAFKNEENKFDYKFKGIK